MSSVVAPQLRDFPAELGVNPMQVVFLEGEEKEELSMTARAVKAAEENPSTPVKVKVQAPFRVVHEAKPYVGGDVLEVPNDIADTWIKAKWAEPVSQKEK